MGLANVREYGQSGFYSLVVLCLHEVELLFDAVAVLHDCEFERRIGLLRRTLR